MLTIGKLAKVGDVSHDTLRYYEREGLLTPAGRSESGYRLYDEHALRRIRFIQHAQSCGFTLAEVRDLLQLRRDERACCQDVRQLAVEKKLQLAAKIRAMQAMSDALDRLIAECSGGDMGLDDCPILAALEAVNGGKEEAS